MCIIYIIYIHIASWIILSLVLVWNWLGKMHHESGWLGGVKTLPERVGDLTCSEYEIFLVEHHSSGKRKPMFQRFISLKTPQATMAVYSVSFHWVFSSASRGETLRHFPRPLDWLHQPKHHTQLSIACRSLGGKGRMLERDLDDWSAIRKTVQKNVDKDIWNDVKYVCSISMYYNGVVLPC